MCTAAVYLKLNCSTNEWNENKKNDTFIGGHCITNWIDIFIQKFWFPPSGVTQTKRQRQTITNWLLFKCDVSTDCVDHPRLSIHSLDGFFSESNWPFWLVLHRLEWFLSTTDYCLHFAPEFLSIEVHNCVDDTVQLDWAFSRARNDLRIKHKNTQRYEWLISCCQQH